MKFSKAQMTLAYLIGGCQIVVIFHKSLGLADYWQTAFEALTILCVVVIFMLWKPRTSALAGERVHSESEPQSRTNVWLKVFVLAIMFAASPFILRYIGMDVSFARLAVASVVTFVFLAGIFLLLEMRRGRNRKHQVPNRR